MMNDTVREELQTKIAPAGNSGKLSSRPIARTMPATMPTVMKQPEPIMQKAAPKSETLVSQQPAPKANIPPTVQKTVPTPPVRTVTSDLGVKKTSPTLVGFQSKNPTMPDWRLQLQNSVRQRSSGTPQPVMTEAKAATTRQKQSTNGANALKIEPSPDPTPPVHANPRVANALRRIEDSRRTFLETDAPNAVAAAKPATAARAYPFNVVSRFPGSPTEPTAPVPAPTPAAAKPRLISSLKIEKRGLDTNKLPPLPAPAKTASIPASEEPAEMQQSGLVPDEQRRLDFKSETRGETVVETEQTDEFAEYELEETDDLAPFSMRFGAGLFDVIIGGFATTILLSPLMLSGGSWMSFSGGLAFSAALAIVLFTYLTLTVGFTGRTFGMRLFSLEMIDAEENAYPTLHQAAVSSSVYLLSIALGGIGFLPILFNEEKRAAHDLLSGTIQIREM